MVQFALPPLERLALVCCWAPMYESCGRGVHCLCVIWQLGHCLAACAASGDLGSFMMLISHSQTATSIPFYMVMLSVGDVGSGGPPIPNPFHPRMHCLPNTFDRYGDK